MLHFKLGVPASAIEAFGKANATRDEAVISGNDGAKCRFGVYHSSEISRPVECNGFSSRVLWQVCYHEVAPVETPEYTREECEDGVWLDCIPSGN